jgi:ribosome-interacting GTPase 1
MNNQTNLYIKDQEIIRVIESLEKDDENSLKDAIKVLLIVMADTRRFLRQVYKEMPKNENIQKVYTKPTGNKEDIIIGQKKMKELLIKNH